MGCCVSSATTDKKDELLSGNNTAPPQSVVEEETIVKEVLSETTFLTSCDDNSTMEKMTTTTKKIPEEEEKKPGIVDAALDPVLIKPSSIEPEKVSEVSEMCSLSESLLSIVNGYGEEEVKQKNSHGVRQRSPAKSRNRVMVNYPTRRNDMSPRRRNTEGGGAERRSRSPAMNRSGMMGPTWNQNSTDCGGAMKKKSQSPCRVRPDPNKNGSEQDCNHQRQQWPSCGTVGGNYNSTPNDSFENPLVSLECFIFL